MRKKAKNICAWMLVAAVFILSGNTVYADTWYEEGGFLGWIDIIYYAPYADGIDYTAVFDVEYYYANNPDLQQTIGKNDALLFQDFLDNGMALGRQGSAYFDVNIYRKENPQFDWCEIMVVSNISWSKNPFNGPVNGKNDWRYIGESFYSGGYITLNCVHEHGEKHY